MRSCGTISQVSIARIQEVSLEAAEGLSHDFVYPDDGHEPSQAERLSAALIGVVQRILPRRNIPSELRLESGYRRFVCLLWLVCPEELPSASSVPKLAKLLNIEPGHYYEVREDLRGLLAEALPEGGPAELRDQQLKALQSMMRRVLPEGCSLGRRRWMAGYRAFVIMAWMLDADTLGGIGIKDLKAELKIGKSRIYDIYAKLEI